MIENMMLYLVLGVAVAVGLAALFFYFVKPNATVHGLKVKYILTAIFTILGSVFIFLLRFKLGKDSAKIGELDSKLKLKIVESSLAVNHHNINTNLSKMTEIDSQVKTLNTDAERNAEKIKELEAQRLSLTLQHERDVSDFQKNTIEKSSLEYLVANAKRRLEQ